MMQLQNLCDFIRSHATERLSLTSLAAKAGLSPYHFHRTFKARIGVTPMQFAESCRLQALKSALRTRRSVTDAVYEAGFGSGSRVYEHSNRDLGMTPAQYRDRGKGLAISYASASFAHGRFAQGRMMLAATDRGLCFLQWADSDDKLLKMLRTEYPEAHLEKMSTRNRGLFQQWIASLQKHLAGGTGPNPPLLNLPLDLRASAFQTQVWNYLRTIPAGSVRSYSEVAAGIGKPGAARAVARACSANRVALLIPCHRVIRGNGDLGGYRWGNDLKRVLLEAERNQSQ